jgi:hypothetical protein
MGQDLMSTSSPFVVMRRYLPADTTTEQTIMAASTRNRRIDHIYLTSSDTADRSFNLDLDDGTILCHLCNVVVLANTGYGIPLPDDPFDHSFPTLTEGLPIPAGMMLKGNLYQAITAACFIDVIVLGGYV